MLPDTPSVIFGSLKVAELAVVVYEFQLGRYLLRRGIGSCNGFSTAANASFAFLVDVIVGYLGISLGDVVVFDLVFSVSSISFNRHSNAIESNLLMV